LVLAVEESHQRTLPKACAGTSAAQQVPKQSEKMQLVLHVMSKRTVDPLIKGCYRNQGWIWNQGEIGQLCRREIH